MFLIIIIVIFVIIITNLAKVVTSLIAEHMKQVVEDAFQHSRPCDEHVELSETRERCKKEEKSSRHLSM